MKEIEIKFEIKNNSGKSITGLKRTEYDENKWYKINSICKERKVSIFNLIEDVLERMTIEEAEKIITSWDI